jgi:hypothetical protein
MIGYTAVYFLANRSVGTSQILSHIYPHSVVYVCPTCGEAWGRIFISGGESQYWEMEPTPCEKHQPSGVQDWGRVPGSLIVGTEISKRDMRVTAWGRAIEHLPEGLLKREFDLNANWYEGKLKDAQEPNEGS